jgi:hypothetical protein
VVLCKVEHGLPPVAGLQELWKETENSENKDTPEPDAVTLAELAEKIILLNRK